MLESLNGLALGVTDTALGWLLDYPRELAILALAALSSGLLVAARRWTTNQDHLKRCAEDKKRLKVLIREAKAAKDVDALRRQRRTLATVEAMRFRAEGRPLLIALLPVALLAVWGFQRLEYEPPRAGEPLQVAAYFPLTAVGELVHVVPMEGLESRDGWVKVVEAVGGDGAPHGVAAWTLKAEARPEPYEVELRHGDATYRKKLRVGQRTYEAPIDFHDERVRASEVLLASVRPFGVVPGFPDLFLPAWLLTYLILVLPLPALFRKLGKVS